MRLIGVATYLNEYVYHWKHAAELRGWNAKLLGMGRPWKGFRAYCSLLLSEIEQHPRTELIMITDVFDALVQQSPDAAERVYRQADTPILIGGDKLCTSICYKTARTRCRSGGWNVQSGAMIGIAGALGDMYRWILANADTASEQYAIGHYWSAHCDRIKVDSTGSLVSNWLNSHLDSIPIHWDRRRRLYVTNSGIAPIVVHMPMQAGDFNVRSTQVREHLIPHLKINPGSIVESSQWAWKHGMHGRNLPYTILTFVAIVLFIILCCGAGVTFARRKHPPSAS